MLRLFGSCGGRTLAVEKVGGGGRKWLCGGEREGGKGRWCKQYFSVHFFIRILLGDILEVVYKLYHAR